MEIGVWMLLPLAASSLAVFASLRANLGQGKWIVYCSVIGSSPIFFPLSLPLPFTLSLPPACLCFFVFALHICPPSFPSPTKSPCAPNRSLSSSVSNGGIMNLEMMLFTLLVLDRRTSLHLLQLVTHTKQCYQLGAEIVFWPPVKVALLLWYSMFPYYSSLIIMTILGAERLGVSTMQWFI